MIKDVVARRAGPRAWAALPVDVPRLSEEERRHLCELDFDRSAVVFPWRPIEQGQEIAVDYRLNAFDEDERWLCLCGAAGCTGEVVGSFFSLPPPAQEAYLAPCSAVHPPFIRREYRRRSREGPAGPAEGADPPER